ncbi:hypothetical protein KR200_005365 [Drosophila serrata]|nr:hypothetical protein KR200_005365 [Drosophila serrata]
MEVSSPNINSIKLNTCTALAFLMNGNSPTGITTVTLSPAVIERDSEGRPLRRGYVPVEQKILQELQDLKSRETELKRLRKNKRQNTLKASLQLSTDDKADADDDDDEDSEVEHCYGPGKLRNRVVQEVVLQVEQRPSSDLISNPDPVKCRWLKKWIKKCDDNSETSNYVAANTKEHAAEGRKEGVQRVQTAEIKADELQQCASNGQLSTDEADADDVEVEHCYGPEKLGNAQSTQELDRNGQVFDNLLKGVRFSLNFHSYINSNEPEIVHKPAGNRSLNAAAYIANGASNGSINGMRPDMSLAQLCDLMPKEAPSSRGLIAQWKSLIKKNA